MPTNEDQIRQLKYITTYFNFVKNNLDIINTIKLRDSPLINESELKVISMMLTNDITDNIQPEVYNKIYNKHNNIYKLIQQLYEILPFSKEYTFYRKYITAYINDNIEDKVKEGSSEITPFYQSDGYLQISSNLTEAAAIFGTTQEVIRNYPIWYHRYDLISNYKYKSKSSLVRSSDIIKKYTNQIYIQNNIKQYKKKKIHDYDIDRKIKKKIKQLVTEKLLNKFYEYIKKYLCYIIKDIFIDKIDIQTDIDSLNEYYDIYKNLVDYIGNNKYYNILDLDKKSSYDDILYSYKNEKQEHTLTPEKEKAYNIIKNEKLRDYDYDIMYIYDDILDIFNYTLGKYIKKLTEIFNKNIDKCNALGDNCNMINYLSDYDNEFNIILIPPGEISITSYSSESCKSASCEKRIKHINTFISKIETNNISEREKFVSTFPLLHNICSTSKINIIKRLENKQYENLRPKEDDDEVSKIIEPPSIMTIHITIADDKNLLRNFLLYTQQDDIIELDITLIIKNVSKKIQLIYEFMDDSKLININIYKFSSSYEKKGTINLTFSNISKHQNSNIIKLDELKKDTIFTFKIKNKDKGISQIIEKSNITIRDPTDNVFNLTDAVRTNYDDTMMYKNRLNTLDINNLSEYLLGGSNSDMSEMSDMPDMSNSDGDSGSSSGAEPALALALDPSDEPERKITATRFIFFYKIMEFIRHITNLLLKDTAENKDEINKRQILKLMRMYISDSHIHSDEAKDENCIYSSKNMKCPNREILWDFLRGKGIDYITIEITQCSTFVDETETSESKKYLERNYTNNIVILYILFTLTYIKDYLEYSSYYGTINTYIMNIIIKIIRILNGGLNTVLILNTRDYDKHVLSTYTKDIFTNDTSLFLLQPYNSKYIKSFFSEIYVSDIEQYQTIKQEIDVFGEEGWKIGNLQFSLKHFSTIDDFRGLT